MIIFLGRERKRGRYRRREGKKSSYPVGLRHRRRDHEVDLFLQFSRRKKKREPEEKGRRRGKGNLLVYSSRAPCTGGTVMI